MSAHIAIGGAVEIRLQKDKGARGSDKCRGPNCNKPAAYFGRTFHADGSIQTWPSDAKGNPVAMFSGCVCAVDGAGTVTCKCAGSCKCSTKEKVVKMSSQVTALEKQIAASLGLPEATYIAARDRRSRERSGAPAVTLDAAAVCRQLDISESKFAIAAANRRDGRPLVMSAGSQTGSGLIGPAIVDEAFGEYRSEIEGSSVDHIALIREAENP